MELPPPRREEHGRERVVRHPEVQYRSVTVPEVVHVRQRCCLSLSRQLRPGGAESRSSGLFVHRSPRLSIPDPFPLPTRVSPGSRIFPNPTVFGKDWVSECRVRGMCSFGREV